jgi:hypothetical protein
VTDTLFDYADRQAAPRARATDPWTSQDAALGSKANDLRLVLAAHARHPHGLTDFELAELVHRQQTSAGKRRGELRDDGLIEATADARPAPSGKRAIVWRITPSGLALYRLVSPVKEPA